MQFKSWKFVFGAIVIIFAIYAFVIIISGIEMNNKGLFGDSFGALTALFSALAFGALVVTLWQQQEDLELTREELKKSVEALQEQSASLQQQNFENTFFKMVDLHNQMTDEIYDIFTKNIEWLYKKIPFGGETNISPRPSVRTNRSLNKYNSFYDENEKQIGHYFRNLYQVLKFLDNAEIDNEQFYADIFRAQFSSTELAFLFFHALSKHGNEKLKSLIEKFAFFEPLFLDESYLPEYIKQYDEKAFGDNSARKDAIEKSKEKSIKDS
jgi:hypothetical protein